MRLRLLIVSTLDSKEPFGAFTRPFYLGQYLSEHFEVCQLGIDCSAVDYSASKSIGARGLKTYITAVRQQIERFNPDVVYAQETLPGIATLLATRFGSRKKPALVFDFHTLSANEYWTRLSVSANKLEVLKQFVKTYVAQGLLVFSGQPIIGAGKPVVDDIKKWFGVSHARIHCVGNGVPEDLLESTDSSQNSDPASDPYQTLRPAKIAVVVAPKTFQFPSNDMSADMTLDIANQLKKHDQDLHFVVIGREETDITRPVPKNVTFTGFLPSRQDFVSHLKQADISLLPFPKEAVAGGARNKSLDFLACHNLVISTPEGMRGLAAFRNGEHLLISEDSVTSLANTVLEACKNLAQYEPVVDASVQKVQQEYSWQAKAENVAKIISDHYQQSQQ
ncbi:MAG: glycosyltransferase family 4 protein [Cyanobacteria bacterium J06621_11]